MVYKVLIVDDSAFYRRRLKEIINDDRELEVVGEAKNGEEALTLIKSLRPNVVTMDVEMPVMDGISAVKSIMKQCPVPVIMFSSLTHQGAQATLDALEAGALDFLPKKFEDIAKDRMEASILLRAKIRMLARRGNLGFRETNREHAKVSTRPLPNNAPKTTFIRSSNLLSGRADIAPTQAVVSSVKPSGKHYQCLAIGASTGGPVALQKVLVKLPASISVPIILVQHMPGTFTKAFAERLNQHCNIRIKEAEHGDVLQPGHAYLAPGGKQMTVEAVAGRQRIVITESRDLSDAKIGYKPSVDITFHSLAKVFGGDVLAVILTGMGADGKQGCATLKSHSAKIWAQDQASSVVYGMPQAIANANISEFSISLDNIGDCIVTEMCM
jgi:two-component system chemotaxis response regulator CheB